jgi:hypothetical protein
MPAGDNLQGTSLWLLLSSLDPLHSFRFLEEQSDVAAASDAVFPRGNMWLDTKTLGGVIWLSNIEN